MESQTKTEWLLSRMGQRDQERLGVFFDPLGSTLVSSRIFWLLDHPRKGQLFPGVFFCSKQELLKKPCKSWIWAKPARLILVLLESSPGSFKDKIRRDYFLQNWHVSCSSTAYRLWLVATLSNWKFARWENIYLFCLQTDCSALFARTFITWECCCFWC